MNERLCGICKSLNDKKKYGTKTITNYSHSNCKDSRFCRCQCNDDRGVN